MSINQGQQQFMDKLNEFSELLKETTQFHAEHIMKLSQQQLQIIKYHRHLMQSDAIESDIDNPAWEEFKDQCNYFETQVKTAHYLFQQQIKLVNAQLGSFSNHWGTYLEQLAVAHFLQTLRKELGVNTWVQKFRRNWHKSKNIEIDILALNEDTVFIIEVKNQLKLEYMKQIESNKLKLAEQVPELDVFKKQFIIMCMHSQPDVVQEFDDSVWIIQYNGLMPQNETDDWVWLKKKIS